MKIFLDPGHNYSGNDTGASGFGLREEIVTYDIAVYLRNLLINVGHQVKMSRNSVTDNVGNGTVLSSLNERAKMSNTWGADLFISIHCNAFDKKAHGTETLVYSLSSKAAETAAKVQQSIVDKLGTTDRGVKEQSGLVVLKNTSAPALLIETAFIDNEDDSWLLKTRQEDFAKAIFEGITGTKAKEETKVAQTVMELNGKIYVQEINPIDFNIITCDCTKKDINLPNYFNCGYFAVEKGDKTIPVGNLMADGKIITQAKDNPDWINLSKKSLTTIFTTKDGECDIAKTDVLDDDIMLSRHIKSAISGIPIIVGGKYVSMEQIKSEGYFGNELYDTWHGFLGIRHNKLVYVAMKCGFDEMCWRLVALGIYNAIKLDGGGSFILKNGKILEATSENRRIHNVGVWKE